MAEVLLLSEAQMRRIEPYFRFRTDCDLTRRSIIGFVLEPARCVQQHLRRTGRKGSKSSFPMIGATHPEAYRTAVF